MKIVFVSGVEFGKKCLEKVLSEGFSLTAVFSLPESESQRSGYADFKTLTHRFGVPLYRFTDLNSDEPLAELRKIAPDWVIVIGWSGILKKQFLDIPSKGVIGNHPTLLPKHRGNAPIPWTLINGLTKSGTTFFKMTEEIDAGDILVQREFSVSLDDDASSLYLKAMAATADALKELLHDINNHSLIPKMQDISRVSRWPKRRPEDGIIDWNCMTIYIYNWIRGLSHPYPGAFTLLHGRKLIIWKARMVSLTGEEAAAESSPGHVIEAGERLVVSTGDGAIELLRVQLEGEEELNSKEFVKKHRLLEDIVLG